MTVRTVTKSLAGMEDLAAGVGKTQQVRAGLTVEVGQIDQPYAVVDESALADIDVSNFTYGRIGNVEYRYDSDATEGDIKSNVGPGWWLIDGNSLYAQLIAHAGDSQSALGAIHPVESTKSAAVGDTGLVNVKFLTDYSVPPGSRYEISEVVNGEITALDFSAGTATIGGADVKLFRVEVNDFVLSGWPGTLLSAIEFSAASGRTLVIDKTVDNLPSTIVTSLTGFNIEFRPGAKLTLADSINQSLLRFMSCSDFNLSGRLHADGNKANNPGAGSSGTFASFFLIGFQDCFDFTLGDIDVVNAHTGGIGLYDCYNFEGGKLKSDGARELNVSVSGSGAIDSQIATNWNLIAMQGDNSENNHGTRVSNTSEFSVIVNRGSGNGSNGCLYEVACQNGSVTQIKAKDNAVNGGKVEESKNVVFGTIDSDSNGFHGWGVINSEDTTIALISANSNTSSGLYVYSQAAPTPTRKLTVGNVKALENDRGIFVEQQGGGSVLDISIGNVDLQLNEYGYYSEDIILESEVKISSGNIINNNVTDVFALDGTQKPKLGLAVEVGSINYSTTSTLTPDNSLPKIEKSARTFRTANTGNTVVNRLLDDDVLDKTIVIRVEDSFTTFENGAGVGRLIVSGGTLPTASGEVFQATKFTSANGADYFWNLYKVL